MHTANAPLRHWLRLLWDKAPPLHLDSTEPFIARGGIHLPAREHWQEHCAAAAHAAAHLVYSPAGFDGSTLAPIARTLLALLEDARVEALAMRELPGLARLWRPLHTVTPAAGQACEDLMRRLTRALADPAYADPHPWVAKGRRLFYLDEGLALLALRTPRELREAALRLGHDLGQMRLPFNAKGYRCWPAYRDDHRWMWPAEQLETVTPPPLAAPVAVAGSLAPEPWPEEEAEELGAALHPEWDRLIQRLRPGWTRVVELAPPAPDAAPHAPDIQAQQLSRRLLGPLRALLSTAQPSRRGSSGDDFIVDALVDWRVAHRHRGAPDVRVYRETRRSPSGVAVYLLIDASASSALALGSTGSSGLQIAAQAAVGIAGALQALAARCAVTSFHSNGRHAVRCRQLKRWGDHGDTWQACVHALQSVGSTRLGAALRHAASQLRVHKTRERWLVLLSDGQPHDVDVHDSKYLVEDARHAVRAAQHAGVRVVGIALASPVAARARDAGFARLLDPRRVQSLARIEELPRLLVRLRRNMG